VTLRVGTRGSALARAQARLVVERLEAAGHPTQIIVVQTEGDRAQGDQSIVFVRGAFVGTLERALVAGRIDMAVHSAKDLPSGEREGVTVAAYPPRGEARDAIVSRDAGGLDGLPLRARVGTESPRRRAFLLHARPDLEIMPLRGNVDTRLRTLDSGEVEGLVLAAVGLERLGLCDRIAEVLSLEKMIPAVGQGALAVQTRVEDAGAAWARALDDPTTRRAVASERRFLAAIGGGCRAPFAAHAWSRGERLTITGAALSPDGRAIVRDEVEGGAEEAEAIGIELAERLLACGAERLAAGGAA
jgi:hydroxymethylbilane synthase